MRNVHLHTDCTASQNPTHGIRKLCSEVRQQGDRTGGCSGGLVALDAQLRQHLRQLLHALLLLLLLTRRGSDMRRRCTVEFPIVQLMLEFRLAPQAQSAASSASDRMLTRMCHASGSASCANDTQHSAQASIALCALQLMQSTVLGSHLHRHVSDFAPPSSTAAALLCAQPLLPRLPASPLPLAGLRALRRWAAARVPPPALSPHLHSEQRSPSCTATESDIV